MEIPLSSIDQAFNILVSLTCMQLTKYIRITPIITWSIRIAYLISQLLLFLFISIIKKRIAMVNDRRKVRVFKELKWNEVPDDEDEYEEITFSEYDSREVKRLMKTSLFQLPIVIFLHVKFSLPQPMILQVVSLVKSFFLIRCLLRI